MLMYQKIMFDRYYCMKTFCLSKTLEKMLRKYIVSCVYNGVERHVICERFENADPRAKTNGILTSATVYVTYDDVSFCDGPGMLIHETAKPCINTT